MNAYTEKMREIAARILKDGTVEAVIGYTQAALPAMTRPIRITKPEEAELLVFNGNCRLNLANYLKGIKGRVGIVAKGCDSRNIVIQTHENRVKRDQLFIIGMPCAGMVDKNRLYNAVPGEILFMEDQGEVIEVETADGKVKIDRRDLLQDNCKTCIQCNPVISDEMAGDELDQQEPSERFADVEKIEAMGTKEKQVMFDDLIANCIRCYACRDACPLCYCPTCFVDESRPQWVGKTNDPVDVKTYHLLRAFHDAGRCTDCGACEAACPMDIKVRQFTRKTIKDSVAFYGLEAGMSETVHPALDLFRLDDPEEFIR